MNRQKYRTLRAAGITTVALALGATAVTGCSMPKAGAASKTSSQDPAATAGAESAPGDSGYSDGTPTSSSGSRSSFNVVERDDSSIAVVRAVSATLKPAGDDLWTVELSGLEPNVTRMIGTNTSPASTADFFADGEEIKLRVGTANAVMSGTSDGRSEHNLIMSVSSPELTEPTTATFEGSSITSGRIDRALAKKSSVPLGDDGSTGRGAESLADEPVEPFVLSDVELFIGLDPAVAVDNCVIAPQTPCPDSDLFQSNLVDKDLHRADLEGSNLAMSTLTGTDFSEARMNRVQMFRSDLTGAKFTEANLQGADMHQSTLTNADLSDIDGKFINLFRAELGGANLKGADLSDGNLSQVVGASLQLAGANLSHATLAGADLRNSDLSGADLSYANLAGTNLAGANLTGANLEGTMLWQSAINDANLTAVRWNQTTCPDGTITQVTNKGSDKKPAIVTGCSAIFIPADVVSELLGPRATAGPRKLPNS